MNETSSAVEKLVVVVFEEDPSYSEEKSVPLNTSSLSDRHTSKFPSNEEAS